MKILTIILSPLLLFKYFFLGVFLCFYSIVNVAFLIVSFPFRIFIKTPLEDDKPKKNRVGNSLQIVLTLFLVFFGVGILGFKMYTSYVEMEMSRKQIADFFLNIREIDTEDDIPIVKPDPNNPVEPAPQPNPPPNPGNGSPIAGFESFAAVIQIPSTNLIQGIVKSDYAGTTIHKNVSYLYYSDLPSVVGGNYVVAAHSGNSSVGFFKNNDRIVLGDTVYIYYGGYRYTYTVVKKFEVIQTDLSVVDREPGMTKITLTTCKKGSDTIRLIVVGKLDSKDPI